MTRMLQTVGPSLKIEYQFIKLQSLILSERFSFLIGKDLKVLVFQSPTSSKCLKVIHILHFNFCWMTDGWTRGLLQKSVIS